LAVAGSFLAGSADAKPWWVKGADDNDTDFLPPDAAFRVGARVDGTVLHIRWVIADGYYLYRGRMDIQAESPDLKLSAPLFPKGVLKTDPYLGTQEIFEQQVEATAALERSDGGAHPLEIKVTYQGCATAGLCYPPITKVLFPGDTAQTPPMAQHPWEGIAIGGGGLAFLLAGLVLRRGRHLDSPAA
jgi:thiol:disulfide interchange protein DsbD